ncbi:hypothetical protein EMPS_01023 [Entomortierella parvispora]|uniref:FAD-binding domain-containing protein n=1 Tax=Entomortierella parvispora TaxID=205924 RepID=A0A9P3LSE3_9FUNG|nr:hypothetical protein EMPS_01023 [Entomortierella parvispora]
MNPHRPSKPVDEFDDTPFKYPSQLPPTSDGKNPNVIIVGAGISGLYLAILLDKAGIPYEIYERAKEVKPLGSVMSLNGSILASMEQVPKERIHFSKKVLSMEQNKDGVMIRCADNTTYHGDVLVGADGAYSGVRQSLYKMLERKKVLPPSDAEDMNKGFNCLVGTTDPMDPVKYPVVAREDSIFSQVIGKGTHYTWAEFNVPENRICWVVVSQLATLGEAEKTRFRNSTWGSESHADMINDVKDFRVPGGGTLGNLIDHTPKENISRVFWEEKLFETWTHGRTVLIGDAAHKLLPSAGQGAVCAMQDSVILANCLYDLKSLKYESIVEALEDFKEQRFENVKKQFKTSKANAIFLHGQVRE